MKRRLGFLLVAVLLSAQTLAEVKKTRSGICHPSQSNSYDSVYAVATFSSLTQCLKAGGRLPKYTSRFIVDAATNGSYFIDNFDNNKWNQWRAMGMDTTNLRNAYLSRKSLIPVTMSTDGRSVEYGLWYSPYTGKEYTRAADIDVEHVVPMFFVYSHGGAEWSNTQKKRFFNDHDNLIVIEKRLNREIAAPTPADWLPPNSAFRCQYLHQWESILAKYPSLNPTNYHQQQIIGLKLGCGIKSDVNRMLTASN